MQWDLESTCLVGGHLLDTATVYGTGKIIPSKEMGNTIIKVIIPYYFFLASKANK
jgi:hypothetical protein